MMCFDIMFGNIKDIINNTQKKVNLTIDRQT